MLLKQKDIKQLNIILGIDPGSRITGYGVIEQRGSQLSYRGSGCIRMPEGDLATRLNIIFQGISQLIEQYKPQQFAIEQVFVAHNAGSALKLGQARGAAMVAATQAGLGVAEYSARQIKQAVVGKGAAEKSQVQHMVSSLLNLDGTPQADAADALAVAVCHAHTQQSLISLSGQASRRAHGRFHK